MSSTQVVTCAAIAALVYSNTFTHDFAYDDRRAILENADISGSTPLSNLLSHDFWGTSLSHSGSHKSYRPVTSLTFRLNWSLTGPRPGPFHVTNVLLHSLATALLVRLAGSWAPGQATWIAGLLFAVHPIHTEAVTGVVGRADLLAGVFFLLALLAQGGRWEWSTPLLATVAMLAKEQGVTVLAMCFVQNLVTRNWTSSPATKRQLVRLVLSAIILLSGRVIALGGTPPSFAKADNPAAQSPSWATRTLTFLYLPVAHFLLLICPSRLSYDWSMDAVPLVTSVTDPRNLISLVFYLTLGSLVWQVAVRHWRESRLLRKIGQDYQDSSNISEIGFVRFGGSKRLSSCSQEQKKNGRMDVIALSLSLLILPFIPATNLFFYVGFVVAERILYIPSMGQCILLGWAGAKLFSSLRARPKIQRFMSVALVLTLVANCGRTWTRNMDWAEEGGLYKAGVPINPPKSFSNLANVLSRTGNPVMAEAAFKEALRHKANMADTHYNLGILLQNQGRLSEAKSSYLSAIKFRPKLAAAYLNLGVTYSDLGLKQEAIKILQLGSELDDNGLKDPKTHANARISAMFHLGKLLLEEGKVESAITVLRRAEKRRGEDYKGEGLLNLLGEAYQKGGRTEEAEYWFTMSLAANPNHIPAHLTLAKMLARNSSREREAELLFSRAVSVAPRDPSVYVHYGLYLMDKRRHLEAAKNFQVAATFDPSDYDSVFNSAVAFREAGDLVRAEAYYRDALGLRGDAASHMNLGAMLHLVGKLQEAEQNYIKAWNLRPGDASTKINIQRLHNIMRAKKLKVANVEF